MVFQKIIKQRLRGRSWLCRGSENDADNNDTCTTRTKGMSTISKTLSKKYQSSSSRARYSSSTTTGTSGGGSSSNSGSAVEMRNGSSGDESSSNSGNENSRDSVCIDTLLHQNDNTIPVWKAENFVKAPLVEDDWWEEVDDDDDDDDVDETSSYHASIYGDHGTYSDDDDDESRQQQLHQPYPPIPIWNSITNSSETYSTYHHPIQKLSESYTSSSSVTVSAIDGKRFVNRGLHIWHQARHKWLSNSQHNSVKIKHGSTKQPIPIPESFRKELVQCLIDRRQFELSHSIPLSCVINAYEEVWRENGCD